MATDDITSEPGKILLIPVDGSGNSWNAFNCECFGVPLFFHINSTHIQQTKEYSTPR